MTPHVMHQFWDLIELTQTNILLNLDDAALVRWLVNQFKAQGKINPDETQVLSAYIQDRLPLIRDMAQDRRLLCQQ